ncbi:MAG: hypothetical protein HQM13_13305 [SAR324 cluster bacterium]|nr:hypothetical protein [SAR324 cluster bacterium]
MEFAVIINLLVMIGLLSLFFAICYAEELSAKQRVSFLSIHFDEKSPLAVQFKQSGKKDGLVRFSKKTRGMGGKTTVSLQRNRKFGFEFYGNLDQVGTIDLRSNGNQDIFFTNLDGGSGETIVGLNLICPSKSETLSLSLTSFHEKTNPFPSVKRSKNFFQKHLKEESEFLERIKFDYGFLDEKDAINQIDDPRLAYYFWKKFNARVEDGKIRIQQYPGKPRESNSIEDELTENGIVFTAHFRAGVVTFDQQKNEHSILFHPGSSDSWPIVLEKTGPYLLIGTKGEGLVIINTETSHLKRFQGDSFDREIWEIEVGPEKILLNQSISIDRPKF